MADREWYITDPSRVGTEYSNFEEAEAAAQNLAAEGTTPDGVLLVRCTATILRRYKRTVTVTAEDVSTA
ncbi:hypothetical protein AB0P05_26610 [Streptomyces flaveolus]|uniref:hypothetical protein n=1 Tax=Streptomyces flaveolus TaxID=67297 RepID=UPI0034198F7E